MSLCKSVLCHMLCQIPLDVNYYLIEWKKEEFNYCQTKQMQ